MKQLDKDKEIIAVCASGARSNKAAQELIDDGFEKVNNMSGGMIN